MARVVASSKEIPNLRAVFEISLSPGLMPFSTLDNACADHPKKAEKSWFRLMRPSRLKRNFLSKCIYFSFPIAHPNERQTK
jgi:hypothetical protein